MSYKKFLGAASAALMIVIALILALAPAAGAAGKYKALHAFHGKDGAQPEAGLILDAAGNLYGTTAEGGDLQCLKLGCGTAFRLTPNADGSWAETVLYSFMGGSDGVDPKGLIFDASGNLYGTTGAGGADNFGTVFKLAPNANGSWTESVLYSFSSFRKGDGEGPDCVIFDAAGNLYGTTASGGAYGPGTVFRLTPNADGSWTESVLYSFNTSDGEGPESVIFDAAGNLYGTTSSGGTGRCADGGCGTVFRLTPNADGSWTESVLHSFNGSDGALPVAGLIFDAAGNLYGATAYGGFHDLGTVFKLTPNGDGSWTESVLHRFRGTPHVFPDAGLIFDGAGNLYGTALYTESLNGAAFKLSPNQDGSWAYSLLHVFQGKPASQPYGLVLGSAGALYGTTRFCNTSCQGVVYQITP